MYLGRYKGQPDHPQVRPSSVSNVLGTEQGQTLLELAISMLIFSLVMVGLYGVLVTQVNGYARERQLRDAQQRVGLIQTMLARDLQRAGYNPTNASFPGILYDPAQLQVSADLDGDGTTTGVNENVVYTYDPGQLRLVRRSGVAQMEFRDIQDFTYSYLDASGTATTVSANIRQVRLSLTARTSLPDPKYPLNGGYQTFQVNFRVAARNLAF